MTNLFRQVANDAVDLLNHCLGQNFHLATDFNRRDWSLSDVGPDLNPRLLAGNDLSEGCIATSSHFAVLTIGAIHDPQMGVHCGDQFPGPAEFVQILEELNGDVVALIRRTVTVFVAVEYLLKLS